MLNYVITIIAILSKCICIGIEYYDDRNLPEEQTEDFPQISPNQRRLGNVDVSKNSNIWEYDVANINDSNPKDNITRGNFTFNSIMVTNSRTTLFNLSFKDYVATFANQKVTMFPSNTIKESEYMYDDEAKPFALRQNFPKSFQYTEINSSGSNFKNPLTEFYNLEPAIHLINLNVHHKYSNCYSLWYVLEDLPCWELPVLYGEFGRQKKTYEVFLMHGGELKNVIENKDDEKWHSTPEVATVPLTYYTNKWCRSAPCYGDHTLCLFSDRYKSGICNEQYRVYVPNISEQIALVNTLNSMRNKIANGESDRYSHLPTAANMKQIIYDYDLENFAKVWLLQCLPGPEPCSALDDTFVNQLECTKFAKHCCVKSFSGQYKTCTPRPECFTAPIIGCLHVWFWNAGDNLSFTDIQCGHTSVLSYSTAQILWATTYKIGCAYSMNGNGDVRVICNFSPGAPYFLDTRYYCGVLKLRGGTEVPIEKNFSDPKFLSSFDINLNQILNRTATERNISDKSEALKLKFEEETNVYWGIEILHKMYQEGRIREKLKDFTNGTRDMIARLVIKYKFIELNGARCDADQPIYIIGAPGSLCVERGRRYYSLCYDFRDPTPGYRLVAVIAPIALFSLILYDLFSGVIRQTNY